MKMDIKIESKASVSIKELADALAYGTPKEFADFWLAFDRACENGGIKMRGDKMEAWAEAMSKDLGGNRKRPLIAIVKMMEYLEVKNSKD